MTRPKPRHYAPAPAITTQRRQDDWIARLSDDPEVWECDRTEEAAIGRLVRRVSKTAEATAYDVFDIYARIRGALGRMNAACSCCGVHDLTSAAARDLEALADATNIGQPPTTTTEKL